MSHEKKQCFVISPIGEVETPAWRRAKGVLDEIISPALEDEYEVRRADDYNASGILDNQIVIAIQEADLVVADLTGHNPNVMYELAVRHITGEPVVQMIEHGSSLPFDIEHVRTLTFRSDLLGRSKAIDELREWCAKALEQPNELGNPITVAALVNAWTAPGADEMQQMLAKIFAAVESSSAQTLRGVRASSPMRARTGSLLGGEPDVCTNCGSVILGLPVVPSRGGQHTTERLCSGCADRLGFGSI